MTNRSGAEAHLSKLLMAVGRWEAHSGRATFDSQVAHLVSEVGEAYQAFRHGGDPRPELADVFLAALYFAARGMRPDGYSDGGRDPDVGALLDAAEAKAAELEGRMR